MAVNLTKRQRIEIKLSKAGVGFGRDPNEDTGLNPDTSAFIPEAKTSK